MSDGDKYAGKVDVRCLRFIFGAADAQPGYTRIVAENFINDVIPLNIGLPFQPTADTGASLLAGSTS